MTERLVQNYDALATSDLRRDALDILEEGYKAILTEGVVREYVKIEEDTVCVKDLDVCFSDYERVFLVAIGKCAVDASLALEDIFGERITDGVVLDVKSGVFKKLRSRVGTHPYPSETNVNAAKEITEMLHVVTERDLVFVVVSGGGSSLLCLPHEMRCEELAEITRSLMDHGADIHEINTVRKHLSDIQGGQLAKIAYPGKVISLIFSDVPGNNIGSIASGPTVLDTTTKEDALAVLEKYDTLKKCSVPQCDLVETPKDEKYFKNVDNIMLVTNLTALEAMKRKAESLGYDTSIETDRLQGEARKKGKEIVRGYEGSRGCCLYGGETTVYVQGNGKGGRNQEFVLGSLGDIQEGQLVLAAASDGWDNSDVAGAFADTALQKKALESEGAVENALRENASYDFFQDMGGSIRTGKTGANVADFYMILHE